MPRAVWKFFRQIQTRGKRRKKMTKEERFLEKLGVGVGIGKIKDFQDKDISIIPIQEEEELTVTLHSGSSKEGYHGYNKSWEVIPLSLLGGWYQLISEEDDSDQYIKGRSSTIKGKNFIAVTKDYYRGGIHYRIYITEKKCEEIKNEIEEEIAKEEEKREEEKLKKEKEIIKNL